ncbi:histidine phosphatase family protein [Anaerosporobacter sp.]|uniref:histidine phosphatase family protein n=1 Tax=Anaerosporobacter sp. TaxID=1872529 RepID=UPI00286F92A3|nr:histidine phosphatase family protein [Anaerosporobacter sp.]
MTEVYFVRHAEPNYNNHDDLTRELSLKGLEDRTLVTQFLNDKNIDIVLSSPYKRAIDTIKEFADSHDLQIELIQDFRERRVDSGWIEDFQAFSKKQWEDFEYKLSDGENLREVQDRNIAALKQNLERYKGKNIVVGSHGTALSTIINYFDPSFGYDDFERIKTLMPWVVRFTFENGECVEIKEYNLFLDR